MARVHTTFVGASGTFRGLLGNQPEIPEAIKTLAGGRLDSISGDALLDMLKSSPRNIQAGHTMGHYTGIHLPTDRSHPTGRGR